MRQHPSSSRSDNCPPKIVTVATAKLSISKVPISSTRMRCVLYKDVDVCMSACAG